MNVTPEIGAAVFSGVHIDTAMRFIRRILQVDRAHLGNYANLEAALVQLSTINGMRNDIIHYGAYSFF
jgi:hypothetical protein